MKKEHFKNIVLTVLVVMNIVLGSNILFDKKLWPSGYNFFNLSNFPLISCFKKENPDVQNVKKAQHLTLPDKIIFNTGDQSTRFSLHSNDGEYNKIIEECNKILTAGLKAKSENIIEILPEEWFSSLMSKSVYLSYYTEFETGFFANSLGIIDTFVDDKIHSFSNVVIALTDDTNIYIEDSNSKKYYKIIINQDSKNFNNMVSEVINDRINDGGAIINYSFDLNFDKPFGDQKTIISSMVPIYSQTQKAPIISVKNPLIFEGKLDNAKINHIATLFNMNPNTAKRYTDAEGSIVYVENNATLMISQKGTIEYKAKDSGIVLAQSGNHYNAISKLNDFLGSIGNITGANKGIYLSSKAFSGENTVTFDYIFQGLPVNVSIDDMNHAVSCTVADGRMKEFKYIARSYNLTNESVFTPEYITAVDETILKYSDINGEITINKMYLAYTDNGISEALSPGWYTEVNTVLYDDKEG